VPEGRAISTEFLGFWEWGRQGGNAKFPIAAQDDLWPADLPASRATASQLRRHVVRDGVGEGGLGECATKHDRFVLHAALAVEAEVVEQLGGAVVDILQDTNVLSYLRENGAPPGAF
jgi:hypothetical protein